MTYVWCRHFRGVILHKTCDAGVPYARVMDQARSGHDRYPCFADSAIAGRCPHAAIPTPEEAAADERERIAHAASYLTMLAEGIACPACGEAISRKERIGRCVYARPCGHRLYASSEAR